MTVLQSTVTGQWYEPEPKFWSDAVLENRSGLSDSKVVIIDGLNDETTTWGQLKLNATAFAANITRRWAPKQGDIVAIVLPNGPWYPVIILALSMAGVVPACISPSLTSSEIEHSLALCTDGAYADSKRSTLAGVICTVSLRERCTAAVHKLPNQDLDIISLDQTSYDSMITAQPDAAIRSLSGSPDKEPAMVFFSSGTTGKPKAVVLSHHNIVANAAQFAAGWPEFFDAKCVNVNVLPVFHAYGSMCTILGGLIYGITVVHFPRFEIKSYIRAIRQHQATHLTIVPPIALALVKHFAALQSQNDSEVGPLLSVTCCMVGSAPLKPALAVQLLTSVMTSKAAIISSYGMTEMAPATHMLPEVDARRVGLTVSLSQTAGRLLPGMEARLLTDEGTVCGPGERGELYLKGVNRMLGYLGNEMATNETINPDNGWLKTGDIFIVDVNGFYTFVGRSKEIIRVKCFQVAPAELEERLLECTEIVDCAVAGEADPVNESEFPVGFVVLRSPQDSLTKEVEAELLKSVLVRTNAKLARYKHMSKLVTLTTIPRSPAGKVLRTQLASINLAAGMAQVTV